MSESGAESEELHKRTPTRSDDASTRPAFAESDVGGGKYTVTCPCLPVQVYYLSLYGFMASDRNGGTPPPPLNPTFQIPKALNPKPLNPQTKPRTIPSSFFRKRSKVPDIFPLRSFRVRLRRKARRQSATKLSISADPPLARVLACCD